MIVTMENLKQTIEYVKENYEKLPKSKNDDGEFVIIAEIDNGGTYDQYKECLGVNSKGNLVWSYLSGCSCSGDNDNKEITDITSKVFAIKEDKNVEEFFEENKIEPYETDYCSY